MADHPNLERARVGYEAFANGDMATLNDVIADDVVWHNGGNSPLSGDYVGKEAVFGLFGQIAQETGGTFENEIHDMLANDEHGVALVVTKGTRGDKTLEERSVHVFHMNDGALTEFWAFPENQSAFDDFWA
ncbi:MAG: nuclear transport factor 2 family protein [Acidimicrobiia bacterium]